MPINFRHGYWMLPLLVVLLSSPISGEDITPEEQADVLLKALSFDRNLTKRAPEGIHIAILYQDDKSAVASLVDAFQKAGREGIRDLSVKATIIPFESVGKLLQTVEKEKINAIYIHSSAETSLSSIQQVTRGRKIPSLVGSKSMVERGAAVGVYRLGDALKVVINLRASRVEGLAFSSGILGVSTVIR